jgi:hypothetical protein
MQIFISWSGERSLQVAKALRIWLPRVIQPSKPWMSETDLEKGIRWETEIGTMLELMKFGIICLTAENLDSRWINFEAGAISKTVEKTFVCTYLIDLKPTDIQGPLSQFNHTRAEKEDTRRLVRTINSALGDTAVGDDVLNDTFEAFWPRLEQNLSHLPSLRETPHPSRTPQELLEEVLGLARSERERIEEMFVLLRSVEGRTPPLLVTKQDSVDNRLLAQMIAVVSKHLKVSSDEANTIAKDVLEGMENELGGGV